MHSTVLESDEFTAITFRPARLQGTFDPNGSSEFLVIGTMMVRGVDHPLTMPVVTEVDGSRITGRTAFTIPFVEWGMKDPSTWYLRVAKEVVVSVDLAGRLTSGK